MTASSANINGNVSSDGGSTVTARGFATSTSSNLSSSVSTSTLSGTTGDFSQTYSNTALTGNTTYYYRAYATNAIGTTLGSITSFLTLPAAPGTPTYTSTIATTTGVTWTAPTGGVGTYQLEQCVNGSSTCSLFTGISSNSTTTYSLAGNTTYDYAVRGNNTTGSGAFSATSSVLTAPDRPNAPSISDVVATSVTITWSAPAGGASTYKLQYCTGSTCVNSTGLAVTSTSSNPLVGNTTYTFAVRGTNATGDGLFSASTTQLTTPDIPTSLTAGTVTATTTALSWSAPTGGASTYKLLQCNTSGTCSQFTGISGVSTTTYSLTGNTSYTYKVLGTNATGDGTYTASTTQLTLPNVPGNPTYSNTTGTSTTISWTAPTGGATTYKLTRCLTSGGSCTEFTAIAGTSYDDTGTLSVGTGYDYAVRATNATGDGLFSATTSISTESGAGTPGTPSYNTTSATTTGVTWTASSPSADTYQLNQCSGGSCTLFSNITANSTTTYSLTGNTTYDYAVRGINAYGTGSFSATSSRLTLPNVPGTPTISNETTSTLTVTWSAPTGGASTYDVARCAGSGCTDFSIVSNDQAGTSFDDSGLIPSTTYTYKVLGSNATGDRLYSFSVEGTTGSGAVETSSRVIRLRGGIRLVGGIRL